jgi:hypothetical protein
VPRLLLGPAVRYVSHDEATVWVETGSPCEVTVLGHAARTFSAFGHHYALVHVRGLPEGEATRYDVRLDGDLVWPRPDDDHPPPAIRTLPGHGREVRLAFGSCRVSLPHHPPYTLTKDEDPRGREVDALYALVRRMRQSGAATWPHVLLSLGDQVYADEVSPRTRDFIAARRDTRRPPGWEVADFEEYAQLYRESWTDPALRWLLSTVSSSMIWDDHDVHDDWNTSEAWVRKMRAQPWWDERIIGAVASYWIYQHLGNLSPAKLAEDELYAQVREAPDATQALREFALRADRETAGTRWSYCRDLGSTRLVVLDSRAGRVLEDGHRAMVDEEEWAWIEDHLDGDFDHVLLATTLPFLLAPALHHLEAWNEAVCDGAWGRAAARAGEWVRQTLDFEHWAAFDRSFDRLAELIGRLGRGEMGGRAPHSIVALSGDVHHAYLADVAFPRGSGVRSAVWQAVCSPVRNPLDAHQRHAIRAAMRRASELVAHRLARSAGVEDPPIRWRVCDGPWFDNQIATLDVDGPRLRLEIERALPGEDEEPRLETVLERRLA